MSIRGRLARAARRMRLPANPISAIDHSGTGFGRCWRTNGLKNATSPAAATGIGRCVKRLANATAPATVAAASSE